MQVPKNLLNAPCTSITAISQQKQNIFYFQFWRAKCLNIKCICMHVCYIKSYNISPKIDVHLNRTGREQGRDLHRSNPFLCSFFWFFSPSAILILCTIIAMDKKLAHPFTLLYSHILFIIFNVPVQVPFILRLDTLWLPFIVGSLSHSQHLRL